MTPKLSTALSSGDTRRRHEAVDKAENNGRVPEKLKLIWGGLTKEDLARRNGRIFELHAMGLTNQQVGERVGLTASRVGQVIREFGP